MSIICCSFSFVYVFNLTYICSGFLLTHYGLMKPYDDRHLGQHWLRWWLAAWWHQAIIAWTITILHTKHNQVIYRFFICSIIGLTHWAFVLDTPLCVQFYTTQLSLHTCRKCNFFLIFFIVCTHTFFHFVECLLNMSLYFCDLSPEESLAEPLMIMSNLCHQSNALIHDCNLMLNTLTDHHGWPTKHLSHMWKKYFEALKFHAL